MFCKFFAHSFIFAKISSSFTLKLVTEVSNFRNFTYN